MVRASCCWARGRRGGSCEHGCPLGCSHCSPSISSGKYVVGVALVFVQSKGTRANTPSRGTLLRVEGGGTFV